MSKRDDELTPRPGRIRDKSFVGQVMRAAKKAGHSGKRFGSSGQRGTGSSFGRGRRAATSLSLRSTSRRVVMKARVVRHQGTRFRSASLASHISYLRREGVTRDGDQAQTFDATSEGADERDFAARCADDHRRRAGKSETALNPLERWEKSKVSVFSPTEKARHAPDEEY